jgi:hypothetical protein
LSFQGVIVHLAVAAAVGAPLIYAGTSKMLDGSRFIGTIPKFRLAVLPPTGASVLAVAATELAAGAWIILSPVAASALLAALVYVALTALMARARLMGASGDCGCFGALGGQIDTGALLRNLGFALAALALAYARANALAVDYELRAGLIGLVILALGSASVETVLDVRQARE